MTTKETRLALFDATCAWVGALNYDQIDAAALAHADALRRERATEPGTCCDDMELAVDEAFVFVEENVAINGLLNKPITYCPWCGAWCGRKEDAK